MSTRRFETTRHTKQLGSRKRVGRHTRKLALDQVKSFVRPNWKSLLFPLFLPVGGSLLLSLRMKGVVRWIFVGAVGTSGPWLVAILVILWTGVGNTLMGLEGEHFTAEILRKFRPHGWILVNGIKIKRAADIDHVLVGPAGLLVIESKWSHNPWPTSDQDQTFMAGAFKRAVSQALRNRKDVEWRFEKDLEGVTIKAVCVLWSNEYSASDPLWFEHRGVLVVRGPALESWLKNLTGVSLQQPDIERVLKVIEHQALSRDAYDLTQTGPPPRTVQKFILDTVVAPFMAFMFVVYGFVLVALAHNIWLYACALFFFAVIGIAALRISYLRRVAIGWLIGDATSSLLLSATLIRLLFR
jgi:hypothetical protein